MNLPEIVLIALLHHGDEDHEEEGPQPGDGVDGGVDQHWQDHRHLNELINSDNIMELKSAKYCSVNNGAMETKCYIFDVMWFNVRNNRQCTWISPIGAETPYNCETKFRLCTSFRYSNEKLIWKICDRPVVQNHTPARKGSVSRDFRDPTVFNTVQFSFSIEKLQNWIIIKEYYCNNLGQFCSLTKKIYVERRDYLRSLPEQCSY